MLMSESIFCYLMKYLYRFMSKIEPQVAIFVKIMQIIVHGSSNYSQSVENLIFCII